MSICPYAWYPTQEEVQAAIAADGRWKAQRALWRRMVGRHLAREYSRQWPRPLMGEAARRRQRALDEGAV